MKIGADTDICPIFTKNLKLKPMQDLLELYKKDTFSDEDNRLINLAIDNQELYTDEIKDDFMDFMYSNIPCKYENEEIWGYTDENYENGLTHKQNFNNLLNYLNN